MLYFDGASIAARQIFLTTKARTHSLGTFLPLPHLLSDIVVDSCVSLVNSKVSEMLRHRLRCFAGIPSSGMETSILNMQCVVYQNARVRVGSDLPNIKLFGARGKES